MSFLPRFSFRPVLTGFSIALLCCFLSENSPSLLAQETSESVVQSTAEVVQEILPETTTTETLVLKESESEEPKIDSQEENTAVTIPLYLDELVDETLQEEVTSEELAGVELVQVSTEKIHKSWRESGFTTILVFLVVLIGSSWFANRYSKKWRMPDHNVRIFILMVCFFGGVAATYLGWHRLTLGIDLRGGVILVYDVHGKVSDETSSQSPDRQNLEQGFDMEQLTRALGMRINPGGVREISITRLGTNQIRIIIPQAEDAEVTRIQRVISESGALEFRILASRLYDADKPIIDRAENELGTTINDMIEGRQVRRAFWVPVSENERRSFEYDTDIVTRSRAGHLEVLVLVDKYNVLGRDIKGIREDLDEHQQPGLGFTLHPNGARRFYALTSENKIDPVQPNRYRRLGILMNSQLYSAPRLNDPISDRGIISFGRRNTADERQALTKEIEHLMNVMNAGSLPADLSPEPVSRLLTGATLGDDTINKGMTSIMIGGTAILLFMVVYYRVAGLIACFAVVMNFFLIMTVMLAIRSAFTLPGLAGLILTLGMAIDANILIFERIREELANGVSLRMSIRNGFDRAFAAIIDTNLTSLIVGIILYWVGNEQIKGFAVTLILGVTFTMFTAIYCCRTIFDVLERTKAVTKLTMSRFLDKPNFDFMGKKRFFLTLSAVCIVVSLLAAVIRGRDILDIDFVGGVSVEAVFTKPQKIGDIRDALNKTENALPAISVSEVQLDAVTASLMERETGVKAEPQTRFIINTSIKPEFSENPNENLVYLTGVLKKEFGDDLRYQTMHAELDEAASHITPATPDSDVTVEPGYQTDRIVANLTVEPIMNHSAIHSKIDTLMKDTIAKGLLENTFHFTVFQSESGSNTTTQQSGGERSGSWVLTMYTNRDNAEVFLQEAETGHEIPYFPTSTTIGGAVAKYAQWQAILAITGSLISIVVYMRFRFHKAIYGFVAALGLIHNVIFTLGCVALSAWLAPVLVFAGVYEFKIGLPEVAAFLMVIGYSLNDTIILFDRLREIKGKLPYITEELINRSINQTLSRTILTSASTAFVVFVLYCFGGSGIHAFSFILLIGVIVGTYSTIYIASTLLYAFTPHGERK